ncbi:response regulator [bacterium]|nr:response regulator [bacterium]
MFSYILIIDKRKELSVKYKKSLESKEVVVSIAGNLKKAYKDLQVSEPDMILISDSIDEDLSDFCQKIRVLTFNTRPVIIGLSKSAEISDKVKILESGADDFISEPVNIEEFKTRIKAHLRRDRENSLDSKTLLPAKNYSLRYLKRVMSNEKYWGCLLIGLENFKNYTDVYTELAGDKLIQAFIAITNSTLEENDFLGQISETEFLIVTTKNKAEKIASFLTFAFDTVVTKFYSGEDVARGYMLIQGDEYAGRRIEFVSISAGVTFSDVTTAKTVKELMNTLKELKNVAKLPYGSNYFAERPKISAVDAVSQKEYNRKIYIKEDDSAMELLLTTTLELQGYDVADSVENNPAIIIIDTGEEMKWLELCKKIKTNSNYKNTKLIVTSNYHNKTTILDTGADLYLPKPYEISTLIKWVEFFIKEANS